MRIHAALFAALLTLPLYACSSADKCTRGTEGCACKEDSRCDTGMTCGEETNRCEKLNCPRGSLGCPCNATGGCNNGMTCNSDEKCVRSTGTAGSGSKSDAGTKTDGGGGTGGRTADAGVRDGGAPVTCTASSFDAACRAFCNAFCKNEEELCATSECDPKECLPDGELYKVCETSCGKDTNCVQKLCMQQSERTCEEFGFEDTNSDVYQSGCFEDDPNCVINPDYGCSDTCGATANTMGMRVDGSLAKNGKCEDGGKNSASSTCPRGTDCSDCGMRTCAKTLGTCANNGDCCGYYAQKSLCVDTGTGGVCLATCVNDGSCPSGQTCKQAMDSQKKVFHVCSP